MRNRRRVGGKASSRGGRGQSLGESLGRARRHSRLGNAGGSDRTARCSPPGEGPCGSAGGSGPRRRATCGTSSRRRSGASRWKSAGGTAGSWRPGPSPTRRSATRGGACRGQCSQGMTRRLTARSPTLQRRPGFCKADAEVAVKMEDRYPAQPPLREESPGSHLQTRAAKRLRRVPAACHWDRPPVPHGLPTSPEDGIARHRRP